jgi:hypothetical protein
VVADDRRVRPVHDRLPGEQVGEEGGGAIGGCRLLLRFGGRRLRQRLQGVHAPASFVRNPYSSSWARHPG